MSAPFAARGAATPAHDVQDDDSSDVSGAAAQSESEAKARAGIQSIEVGFRLLEVLTQEPRAMMLRDLAKRAAMSPAKAHRYLVSFQRLGAVSQDPLTGRYELGGFALQMGLARLARVDGVKLARVALAELHERLDATLGIAVWGNQGPTVVHWIESSRPAKAALKLGDVMPLTGSATGLLFAAYLPAAKTAPLIARELELARRSPHRRGPGTDEALAQCLAQVRERGAARVEGVLLPTIDAFCLPVFDAAGDLALGLIALGPEGEFDISWDGLVASELRGCARRLSYELGYHGQPG